MPYILKSERPALDEAMKFLMVALTGASEGQVNYCLTRLLLSWAREKPSYARYNAVMGILSCVAHEFYRREIAPYERRKAKSNSDVF